MVSTGQALAARTTLPQLIARESSRRRRRRTLRWAALAALLLLIAAAALALRPKPLPLEQRFRTAQVTKGDVLRDVRATGHVEALTTVDVGAEISGRLATVSANFNDRVKKGQVMARFDREVLVAQLAQARASLSAAQAALAQAEVDGQHAVSQLVREERMYQDQASTDANYENAFVAARLAQQRLVAARAQVAAQQAAHDLARTNLSKVEIHAPIDGIVVTRNVDPGQTLASVFQTPVLFTVAADLKAMRVLASVDEADIGEAAPGQRATFTVTAWPSRTFEGAVTEVRNSPILVQDVVTYQVVIGVDNADLALKPGMTASVRLRTASAPGVLRVPDAALRFTPPGEKEAPGVWTLESGKLRHLDARGSISDGEWTAVEGLAPGATVLLDLTPAGRKAYGLAR